MKRVVFASVLSLYLISCAGAEDPVYFADPHLKAVVEEELWISDPTPTDMLGLVSLTANGKGITSLTGLEYAANLVALEATENEISDISVLSGLTNLEKIVLNNNQIGDISVVAGLGNLYHLDIHNNLITDISAVAGLGGLETVILRINQIRDISPLSGLSNLEHLDLRDNQISAIWPLAGLDKLRHVDLYANQISDISPLTSLTCLSRLELRNNPINEEACDVHIPQILQNNPGIDIGHRPCIPLYLSVFCSAGGSVTEPGEGQFAYEYMQVVGISAKADPGFAFAGFSGTYFSGENPAFVTMIQDHQIQVNFLSVLDTLYVEANARGRCAKETGAQECPFHSIQEALEVAREGTTIIVRPGIYRENIDFLRKNIRVIGMDPSDPTQDSWPVLEGTGNGPVVRISGGQRPQCLLTGFVITRGQGQPAGAIYCEDASPTITHCLIVGNRATDPDGAAVYCEDSQAVLINCTMADNYAGPNGAGLTLIDSNVTVLDSILWDNLPNEIRAGGTSLPDIRYCAVRGWWPDWGNIHQNPLFAHAGSWVNPDDPNETLGSANDRAVWVEGDYHLKSQAGRWDPQTQNWVQDEVTSPAIDTGLAASPVGHEPAPNGGRINMGVYGGTAEASKSNIPTTSP